AVNLSVRRVNLAPLLDRSPSDPLAKTISLSSRLILAGSRLTFDDMDSALGGSRIRGHVALNLGDEKSVDGEVGMDALDLAPAFGLAIGAAGHDASEPLGRGLLQGWRGRVAFQALRGTLPGGAELRPVSGVIKGDGQPLTLDAARIAGLDPRAFEVAIRASDDGEATDDNKLRQIVEPALWAGGLAVASAQIPFNIKDGRLRVGATTLDAEGARAIVSGGYDMSADQTDIRAALTSTTAGSATGRPEIQIFAVG